MNEIEVDYLLDILKDFLWHKETEMKESINWQIIYTIAKEHQLLPLVWFQCKKFLPESFKNDISAIYYGQVFRYSSQKKAIEAIKTLVYTALKYGILREHCKLTPL